MSDLWREAMGDVPRSDAEELASIELEKLRDLVRDYFAAEDRIGGSSGGYGWVEYDRARKKLREFMVPAQHAVEHGQWKHPTTKCCVICGSPFEPHPTKRATKQTCSKECRYVLKDGE